MKRFALRLPFRLKCWWEYRQRPKYVIKIIDGQPYIFATALLDRDAIPANLALEEWIAATVDYGQAY